MAKKKEPEFVDRIKNPEKYPYLKNKDGSISTHEMAAEVDEDGNWFVFPTIQYDGKELKRFNSNSEAMDSALKTGNFLKMTSKKEAIDYAKGGYKKGTALEKFNPLAEKAKAAKTFVDALE